MNEERENNTCPDTKLLKEINERLIKIEKRQKTERAVRLIITGIIVAAILAAGLFFSSKTTNMVDEISVLADEIEEVADAFEGVDMEKFKQTVQILSEELDQIDISELETALNSIMSIDLSSFLSAIEKINKFLSSLGNFSLGDLFG